MTVAHEFAHALDCALGGGVYLSSVDPRIRLAFERASAFVTPYAASGLDEYFAEAMRAWVEANDPRSLWPRVTRARLRAVDPVMHGLIAALFATNLAEPGEAHERAKISTHKLRAAREGNAGADRRSNP